MVFFYDISSGNPVCFSNNNKDYFDMNGNAFAFVSNEWWYSYDTGNAIGFQKDNFLYSTNGNPLYFTTDRME